MAQQLSISKELTQKVKKDDDSEEEDADDQPLKLVSSDKENPWINGVKTEPEIDDFISGYRKFWDERNKQNEQEKDNTNKTVSRDESHKNKNVEEPEIKNFNQKKNPVEKLIEEYSNDKENGFSQCNTHKDDDQKTLTTAKIMKNLQKTSKNKLGIKSLNNKVTKVKKAKIKVGTSRWSISPTNEIDKVADSDENNLKDLDEMFDSVEDKIQEKINKKLLKVKKMLDKTTKIEKKKSKINNDDESTNDIDQLGLKGQKNMRPIIDRANQESTSSKPDDESTSIEKISNLVDFNNQATSRKKTTEIDPTKFINMKPKHVGTILPDEIAADGALDDSEAEEDQHQIISEAFADDDVIDEFRKEKEDEVRLGIRIDRILTLFSINVK